MIIGKHSALIGFALLIYIAVAICILAVTATYGGVFGAIVGVINLLCSSFNAYKIYKHYDSVQ